MEKKGLKESGKLVLFIISCFILGIFLLSFINDLFEKKESLQGFCTFWAGTGSDKDGHTYTMATIDCNTTSRMGKPNVYTYVEEYRQYPVKWKENTPYLLHGTGSY